MAHPTSLPEHVRNLAPRETFCFRCQPEVECFTDCCRELDLELTPYDVLRLRQVLNLSSKGFFDRYALIEQEENDSFPHIYLGMVDDGKASCPFVTRKGCKIYEGRPSACRTYPLGRAAYLTKDGGREHFYVLLTEPHCKGFTAEADPFSAEDWIDDQELAVYNSINDESMASYQHRQIKNGKKLSPDQIDLFLLALYRLDEFRQTVLSPDFQSETPLPDADREKFSSDDTALLRYGISWLRHELFGE